MNLFIEKFEIKFEPLLLKASKFLGSTFIASLYISIASSYFYKLSSDEDSY